MKRARSNGSEAEWPGHWTFSDHFQTTFGKGKKNAREHERWQPVSAKIRVTLAKRPHHY